MTSDELVDRILEKIDASDFDEEWELTKESLDLSKEEVDKHIESFENFLESDVAKKILEL